MTRLRRPLALASALIAALALVAVAYPGGPVACIRDLRDASLLNADMRATEWRRSELAIAVRATDERLTGKLAAVDALVAGWADPAATAERFVELNAGDPTSWVYLRSRYGDRPVDELAARSVIHYLENRPGDSAAAKAMAAARRWFDGRYGPQVWPVTTPESASTSEKEPRRKWLPPRR